MSGSNDDDQSSSAADFGRVSGLARRFLSMRNSSQMPGRNTLGPEPPSTGSIVMSPSLASSSHSSDGSKNGFSMFSTNPKSKNQHPGQERADDFGVQTDIVNSILRTKARQHAMHADAEEKVLPEMGDSGIGLVLRPDMPFRRNWDSYILILLLYTATVSVFVFSFLGVLSVGSTLFWIERFIDVSFWIDIGLNFFTAYDQRGTLVTDRKVIRHHYLKTWFVPDVIATFPWDTLALALHKDRSIPSLLQLPRFLRLVRLLKLWRFFRVIRTRQSFTKLEIKLGLKYGYIRLAGLFITVLFVAHWFACLFFYFGEVVTNANATWVLQEGIPEDIFGQYIAALYFSVYTITTIGYGDVTPENTVERSYTTVIMFLGAALFAYIISQVSNVAGELNAASANHRIMMDSLTDFASYRQLPDELVFQIRRYIQREHLRQRVADEKELLTSMSRDLRIKVLKHIYGTHLEESRFFDGIPREHLTDVYDNVSELFARKDEKLFSPNERPNFFYIILNGSVELDEPGVAPVRLSAGEIFGENDMLFNRLRQSRAVCTRYCDIVTVPRDAVMNTLERHPVALQKLRDKEALWLWSRAVDVVQEQLRYTQMARMLRLRGEAHTLQTGGDILRHGEMMGPLSARDSGTVGLQDVSPRRPPLQQMTRQEEAKGAGGGEEEGVALMERLTLKVEAKSREVSRLEGKLLRLQTQLDVIVGGLRGEV